VVVVIKARRSRLVGGLAIGMILGALVGFLLRPSVPLIRQLPFGVVITRGANLNGLDIVLRSTAEQSFNYMLIGAIVVGAVLGAWGGTTRKPSPAVASAPAATAPATRSNVPSESPVSRFCTKCGGALGSDVVFCRACGSRRS
jgi:hypothetical protein